MVIKQIEEALEQAQLKLDAVADADMINFRILKVLHINIQVIIINIDI